MRVSAPEGICIDLRPAGPIPRILAYAVDMAIVWLGIVAILIAFSLFSITGQWILSLTYFVVQWFYMAICESLGGGASPGKRIVGLRTLMRDGTRLRPFAAILRNLLRLADQFMGLGLAVSIVAPGFRRLGDLVAGTIVVHEARRVSRPVPMSAFEGLRPLPPRRPVDEETADAAIEYARRRVALGRDRADELALIGLPLYLGDDPPSGSIGDSPSRTLAGIGAWCAGLRDRGSAGEAGGR